MPPSSFPGHDHSANAMPIPQLEGHQPSRLMSMRHAVASASYSIFAALALCFTPWVSSYGQASAASSTPPQDCSSTSASAALIAGNYKLAAATARIAIAADAACAETHYQLAYALMRLNLAKESLAEYTNAARLRAPRSTDLRNVALDYALLAAYPDAEHWSRRALALDPNDAESWYVLGRIQYSAGGWHDALSSFTHALALTPASIKAENNLGLTYESLNETDAAVDAYRKAIALGEKSSRPSEQPYINLGIVLAHQGKSDEALTLLLKAVEIAPEDAGAREHLGQLYLERGELPPAQAQLEKAVSLEPGNSRLHFLLGQAYRRAGMTEKAKAELALSETLNGTHSTPNYFK